MATRGAERCKSSGKRSFQSIGVTKEWRLYEGVEHYQAEAPTVSNQ